MIYKGMSNMANCIPSVRVSRDSSKVEQYREGGRLLEKTDSTLWLCIRISYVRI